MKRILTTTFIFGIFVFSNILFAQEVSKEQRRVFQTDNLEAFKKVFKKDDLNKCLSMKENSYDLLALSVKYEKKNIFNFMLANSTDINRVCNNQSPLMVAARYGKLDMAKSLLKKGANKSLKNANGETAKDIAVKNQKSDLAAIL